MQAMQWITAVILAAFVGYIGAWYTGAIEGNFALLMFLATFITGLFGINVKGLPWMEHDLGAFFVALSCIGAALLTLVLLRRRGVIGN